MALFVFQDKRRSRDMETITEAEFLAECEVETPDATTTVDAETETVEGS